MTRDWRRWLSLISLLLSFFVNMEYFDSPPPPSRNLSNPPPQEPLSFPLLPQGVSITRNELDVIKLTAQFFAVFGLYLQQDLIPDLEPLFRFTAPTDCMHLFYSQLALAYTRVLRRSEKLRNKDATTVLEGFSTLVHQVLNRADDDEDVVEMAMIYLYAYEFFANLEHGSWPLPPRGYLATVNPPPHLPASQFPHTSKPAPPEDPQPKRLLRFYKPAALVPEDQFLAQHPGSSTIRVSVPQVIEITVQSLSETVASLKDKIANKLKLSGKTGVLEDNKSLAHYNVGAGETLTLSL